MLFFLKFDFKLLQNVKNLLLCDGIDQNFQCDMALTMATTVVVFVRTFCVSAVAAYLHDIQAWRRI